MAKFLPGRPRAALCLLVAGSCALIGANVALSSAANAQANTQAAVNTHAGVDVHDLQPLNASNATPTPHMVNAAVVSGQFEESYKPTPVPPTPVPTIAPTVAPTHEPDARLYESGIASTYGEGDGFEGQLTACGQVFHTGVVQIAHKSLPCGTRVRVEDSSTGRSVDAVVTDRGPYVAGRVVDLSWGAFQKLDPTGPGLLHVNLYVLPK